MSKHRPATVAADPVAALKDAIDEVKHFDTQLADLRDRLEKLPAERDRLVGQFAVATGAEKGDILRKAGEMNLLVDVLPAKIQVIERRRNVLSERLGEEAMAVRNTREPVLRRLADELVSAIADTLRPWVGGPHLAEFTRESTANTLTENALFDLAVTRVAEVSEIGLQIRKLLLQWQNINGSIGAPVADHVLDLVDQSDQLAARWASIRANLPASKAA